MPLIISPFFGQRSGSNVPSSQIISLQNQVESVKDDIDTIIDALADAGLMTYQGAHIAGSNDVNEMLDDIFDGDGSGGQALSEIPDELKDKVISHDEIDEMLNNTFG